MNNVLKMLQMARNPQAFINQMMGNNQAMQNPIIRNALDMYQRGDISGINQLADNLCKEKGIDRKEIEKEILSKIGMN